MGNPSQDYIEMICSLYGSSYDDRIENTAPPTAGTNSRIPGEDWTPGTPAAHKSLGAFQKELKEQGIKLSTSKIKKILVTGGLWTTQQTRAIQSMFAAYTSFPHSVEDKEDENGGQGMTEAEAIRRIAKELEISTVSVSVSPPTVRLSTTSRSRLLMLRGVGSINSAVRTKRTEWNVKLWKMTSTVELRRRMQMKTGLPKS